MQTNASLNIEKLETDLWAAADQLRANSKLTSSDYFMPVLGIIFLRHATNRFEEASRQIRAEQESGKMPKRKVIQQDYFRRRALMLPEQARYDWIMEKAGTDPGGLPGLVNEAMIAVENSYELLKNVLPRDYGIFEPKVLEDLMRLFNSEQIRHAKGDVFGRIYEYFLAEFSVQKAHDNGEFFTPSSLVQMIVNVIEPDHGTVFDPACGSGGMFVQSSHFIEQSGEDTMRKVVFCGQEKNKDTIRIATMNLAVHGLGGRILEAITYYEDKLSLPGKCDFVMANPPFNVDLVDAEKIKADPRLPFGLPGVNKQKKVSNGNYLWISYFWSYLNEKGRAGFVMSSQASSAGHGEKDVRRRIIETGDVDVMISIRSNFFYTRSVPCELWFFDRRKPKHLRDHVLMIDARKIYREVNRKICDFSPEQMSNLSAIVWLYRGQKNRFLDLIKNYIGRICSEISFVSGKLEAFETALKSVRDDLNSATGRISTTKNIDPDKKKSLSESLNELKNAITPYEKDRTRLVGGLERFRKDFDKNPPAANDRQHAAGKLFETDAEHAKGLIKQIDLAYKLASRAADALNGLPLPPGEGRGEGNKKPDTRSIRRMLKQLDEYRKAATDQLRQVVYFHRQVIWLQERFPGAELADVPGLVKLVDRKAIEAADWSLTPGRYVGVAPQEEDGEFDFEQTIKEIHAELAELNLEAEAMAAKIQENFEGLGG